MAEEKKKGGALDNVSLKTLRAQAEKKAAEENQANKSVESKPEEEDGSEIAKIPESAKEEKDAKGFEVSWGDEGESGEEVSSTMPSISDLKAEGESVAPTPDMSDTIKKNSPSKEELGGGIVIEQNDEPKKDGTVIAGPMAPGSETMKGVEETMKELDDMTKIAALRAAATGEKRKGQTVVQVLIDKTGLTNVEFTDSEREKMSVAKKIKVTEIQDESLKHIKMTKPKAINQKTIISKTFSKQYAPFVAPGSGYLGKMRNLSSLEVINLVTIDDRTKNSAESILQKSSLIYSKLHEASVGDFESFDDFAKNTAIIDIDVMLYALIRATYPNEESILMNCGNPKCTHKQRAANGKIIDVPNQFQHRYRNSEILIGDKMSEKLIAEVERIHKASYTKEDAKVAQKEAPIFQEHRYAFGDDNKILVDVYCPTIYEMVENIAKKIDVSDFKDNDAYRPAVNMSAFVKQIALKDEATGDYNVFDDVLSIVDIIYNFDDELLQVLQQVIIDNINVYQYTYGFKAESVVCPHCGHAFEDDVEVEVQQLLFLQAQRHMTNG